MAQINLSDKTYQALLDAAHERGLSPDELIAAGIDALDQIDRTPSGHPMTAEEFSREVLGMTPEDMTQADADARRLYPEAFGEHP